MTRSHVNTVVLVGRLAEDPARRPLAAGGEVVSWRLIVDRPGSGDGRHVVDALACCTFEPGVGGRTATWRKGDLIQVRGSLRRRFWGVDEVRRSRHEVEVYEAAQLFEEQAGSPRGPD
ncbi:single-stranded DNA-binding protein [Actinomadura macrotermitis]|uniref:Single-stranded DNA-binding protein n=1 Tax=Actinomadura macrotermitis TaxID=2585200 RepID=A0A7K0C6M1_9ACTN|nr:single-stranded DNA-binding protein [Actinomadura macrotermitis]MQY08444.1 Single-stranded DNA-binding protein [Actinomadura macrotermitis]